MKKEIIINYPTENSTWRVQLDPKDNYSIVKRRVRSALVTILPENITLSVQGKKVKDTDIPKKGITVTVTITRPANIDTAAVTPSTTTENTNFSDLVTGFFEESPSPNNQAPTAANSRTPLPPIAVSDDEDPAFLRALALSRRFQNNAADFEEDNDPELLQAMQASLNGLTYPHIEIFPEEDDDLQLALALSLSVEEKPKEAQAIIPKPNKKRTERLSSEESETKRRKVDYPPAAVTPLYHAKKERSVNVVTPPAPKINAFNLDIQLLTETDYPTKEAVPKPTEQHFPICVAAGQNIYYAFAVNIIERLRSLQADGLQLTICSKTDETTSKKLITRFQQSAKRNNVDAQFLATLPIQSNCSEAQFTQLMRQNTIDVTQPNAHSAVRKLATKQS